MPEKRRAPVRALPYEAGPAPLLKVNMYGTVNLAVVTDFTFAAIVTV